MRILSGKEGRPWLFKAGVGVLLLQLVVLVAYSTFLYHRDDLGPDFATYSQAWTLIGTGHLNPVDSLQGYPFWRNHLELVMWPLAVLHLIYPQPIVLLWLQDLAIVAAEYLTFAWLWEVASSLGRRQSEVVFTCAAIFTLLSPVWYESVSFDVHLQVLSVPFLVGTGYALWRGKTVAAILTACVAVLFGSVVAVFVAAIGFASLFPFSRRWSPREHLGALTVLVLGIAWYGLVSALGADLGTELPTNYGYLAGHVSHPGLAAILGGVLSHPSRIWNVFWARRWSALRSLALGGLIGVITPIGAMVALVGVLPAAVNQQAEFHLGDRLVSDLARHTVPRRRIGHRGREGFVGGQFVGFAVVGSIERAHLRAAEAAFADQVGAMADRGRNRGVCSRRHPHFGSARRSTSRSFDPTGSRSPDLRRS